MIPRLESGHELKSLPMRRVHSPGEFPDGPESDQPGRDLSERTGFEGAVFPRQDTHP